MTLDSPTVGRGVFLMTEVPLYRGTSTIRQRLLIRPTEGLPLRAVYPAFSYGRGTPVLLRAVHPLPLKRNACKGLPRS